MVTRALYVLWLRFVRRLGVITGLVSGVASWLRGVTGGLRGIAGWLIKGVARWL